MKEQCELTVLENGHALLSVKAARITGFSSQIAEEALAVEEPLEIQLAYGAAESRTVSPSP